MGFGILKVDELGMAAKFSNILGDWTEHFGIYILIETQQMHKNFHFVISSQMLLHDSAY
jgi:hypothetical protein